MVFGWNRHSPHVERYTEEVLRIGEASQGAKRQQVHDSKPVIILQISAELLRRWVAIYIEALRIST